MDSRDAAGLIAPAVSAGEQWADLGAGSGTFTVALARLVGPTGTVFAVDREMSAVAGLRALADSAHEKYPGIVVSHADFTHSLELPLLDGALLANALHFVSDREQSTVLRRVADRLKPTGAIVLVEYDNRPPSQWVPFPVSFLRLRDLARIAGLGTPTEIGRRRSMFGGSMYAARVASR